MVDSDIGDCAGFGHVPRGSGAGVVLGYATPELKQNQVWPTESYFVRLDFDQPDSRRVIDRRRLIPVDA